MPSPRTGSTLTAPSATASIDIAAPPAAVYALVTDLDILAELADEATAMRWVTGSSATSGSRFRGTNRNGRRRWTTTCTVTDAESGRVFAFDVSHGMPSIPISRWQYDFEPTAEGCRVTESTWDRRPGWFKRPAELVTGTRNRPGLNAAHIHATLARLKARAETAQS
jgi:uncharacterized protein YndB with AHSA1/START domain